MSLEATAPSEEEVKRAHDVLNAHWREQERLRAERSRPYVGRFFKTRIILHEEPGNESATWVAVAVTDVDSDGRPFGWRLRVEARRGTLFEGSEFGEPFAGWIEIDEHAFRKVGDGLPLEKK
jgi:hypothetical protein